MNHKIRINARRVKDILHWYLECQCGWEPLPDKASGWRYGRPSWESAFAIGIAHQKHRKDECLCE